MKALVLAFTALFLAGCVTSFDTLDRALPALKGKSIQTAIDYLGIPDQEYVVAGQKVYLWTTATPNMFSKEAETLACRIKMSTNGDVVTRIEYDGSNGACFKYSDRLKPLLGKGG